MLQQNCEPYQPEMLPVLILTSIVSIIGVIMTVKLILKMEERKTVEIKYLTIVYICLTIGIISMTVGLFEALITGYRKEIYMFTLPLAYVGVVAADIFLFIFASKITNRGKKALIPVIVIGIFIIVLLWLPWNFRGQPTENYRGQLYIRTYSTLCFAAYSCIIYITIAIICQSTKKKTDDKVSRVGLSLLFYSVISMIVFFILIFDDNVMITLFNSPGYTIFNLLSWLFALLFVILSYLSLIMPDWLVKRIEK